MNVGWLFAEIERKAKELGYLDENARPVPAKPMPSPRMPTRQRGLPQERMDDREPGEDG